MYPRESMVGTGDADQQILAGWQSGVPRREVREQRLKRPGRRRQVLSYLDVLLPERARLDDLVVERFAIVDRELVV